MSRIALALGCAATLLMVGAASAASPSKAARQGPLVIAKQGEFFVGGHKIQRGGAEKLVDHMYVEYQIPAHRTHRYPIVLIHGGGGTGVTFGSTPDGREGWADYFVRHGYAVYRVDEPTRGRAEWDPDVDGPLSSSPPGSAERMFTAAAKFNQWPQAHLHTQFPGTGLPGDPAYEQFTASISASIDGGKRMDAITRDALVALLDKIGPAILLTHSRSGPFGWLTADARPSLVKAIIAIEPNGPPFKNAAATVANGPPASERDWGITYEPMSFAPAVTNPAELAPVQDPPEAPDLLGCWRIGGAPRTLPKLVGTPIMIVSSEAGYHSQYDHCTSQFLTRAGVANDLVRLGRIGIHGNDHIMMAEKNNREIAGVIDAWLTKRGR